MGLLQQLAVPCLLAGSASATGVRADGAAVSRNLQQETQASTKLGCFQDSRTDRRLSKGSKEQMAFTNMTPDFCNKMCADAGIYSFYAVQYSSECWCGSSNAEYAKLGALDDTACNMPCTGDATLTCGGYDTFELFEYAEPVQPAGYLGCYADDKTDRIFESMTDDVALKAETCKTTCSADSKNAFYGLQFGTECWCGVATDAYARHGPGNCDYRCGGDSTAICGGYTAMNVFALDETATAPPTTAPVTLPPATTVAPVTATLPPAGTVAPVTATLPPAGTVAPVTATLPPAGTVAPVTATLPPAGTVAPVTATLPPAATVAPAVATLPPAATVAPTLPSVTTAAPVAITPGAVLVDLVPCILSSAKIDQDDTPGPFIMQQFFKGYWTPKTLEFVVSATDVITPLLSDTSGTTIRGLCNAVHVGIVASDAQRVELAAYSAQYKVRIVYFGDSASFENGPTLVKLGINTYYGGDIQFPPRVQLTAAGGALASVTSSSLSSDPISGGLFTYPVRSVLAVEGAEILAEYADASGVGIISETYPSVAIMSYKDAAAGSEELYVFFAMGWFETRSWAWAHYIHEWSSKGVFMGERRFYLGAVVDDLFLATPEWVYRTKEEEEALEDEVGSRCSAADMAQLRDVQKDLNTKYPGSDIRTEFAFNGAGILEKVGSEYTPVYIETDVTDKGTKWTSPGQATVQDINWLYNSIPGMTDDFNNGKWSGDDVLADVLADLPNSNFYHQSHTLIHLSRDQLGESDCFNEDTGNVQIALLTGMWDSDNYNWRSMVSPGITGLFNQYCLNSGAQNLMTCYPGDNTFDGSTVDTVLLVNKEEPYHSMYTAVDTAVDPDGYDRAQIVPRFATYVYFNCVTGACLLAQNEAIRRSVCNCENKDPAVDKGVCSPAEKDIVQCTLEDLVTTDIQSFQSIAEIFDTESATTTRYLMAGRRDKYMFHQANIIPTSDLLTDKTVSTLEYWYMRVMEEFSELITFPVKSVKFDDLCTNFQQHEALDDSGGYATMTVEEDGSITGMSYQAGSGAGLVPLTVPTASAKSIALGSLASFQHSVETYGTDTTYYLADSTANIPTANTIPDKSVLPGIPALVSEADAASMMVVETSEEAEQAEEENAEAIAKNEEAANNKGYADEAANGVLPVSATLAPASTATSVPTTTPSA